MQALGLEFGHDPAFAFRPFGEDFAPGVDNHAVAVGTPAAVVQAALGGGDNVALVFDGAGLQQGLPVGFAGGVGEGGGQEEYVKRLLGAEDFGETQVVAHALAVAPAIDFHRRGDAVASFDGVGFAVAFANAGVAEEVGFIIAAEALAVAAVYEQAVDDFAAFVGEQGDAAAE